MESCYHPCLHISRYGNRWKKMRSSLHPISSWSYYRYSWNQGSIGNDVRFYLPWMRNLPWYEGRNDVPKVHVRHKPQRILPCDSLNKNLGLRSSRKRFYLLHSWIWFHYHLSGYTSYHYWYRHHSYHLYKRSYIRKRNNRNRTDLSLFFWADLYGGRADYNWPLRLPCRALHTVNVVRSRNSVRLSLTFPAM